MSLDHLVQEGRAQAPEERSQGRSPPRPNKKWDRRTNANRNPRETRRVPLAKYEREADAHHAKFTCVAACKKSLLGSSIDKKNNGGGGKREENQGKRLKGALDRFQVWGKGGQSASKGSRMLHEVKNATSSSTCVVSSWQEWGRRRASGRGKGGR